MPSRTASDPLRYSSDKGGAPLTTLERRISDLEQLATSQSRELKIQFERIAQMQAEWDIIRIRMNGA